MENSQIKTVAAYLRVSTEAQAKEDSYGLDAQKQEIINYCTKNQIKIKKWYIDEGVSGAALVKPGINEILHDVDSGENIDAVVVAKIDRVSRNIMYYYIYKGKLMERGITLVSVTEDETLKAAGSLAPIFEAFIQAWGAVERDRITERTRGGRTIKASGGGYSGGRVPFGYTAKNKMLVVDEEQAKIVRIIFYLNKRGVTQRGIIRYLDAHGYKSGTGGTWAVSTIHDMLERMKLYQGFYKYGNIGWVKGQHEAILKPKEDWQYPELKEVDDFLCEES